MWEKILQGKRQTPARRQTADRRRERGLQLVEMAMVLPIMFLLIAAIIEFSWYFYTYATLARATRAAAGYVSTKSFDSTAINTAKNMVLCGEVSSDTAYCNNRTKTVSGLALANVDVSLTGTYPDQTITVKVINYSYSPVKFFDLAKFGKNNKWDTTVTKVNAATTMRYIGNR
jgi:Flp pilus assembly protein TadG